MTALTRPRRTKLAQRTSASKHLTVEEYLALPVDKDCRTELIYGERIVMPRPRANHNRILNRQGSILDRWTEHFKLGLVCYDIDMTLDKEKALVYAPDLLFLSNAHAHY